MQFWSKKNNRFTTWTSSAFSDQLFWLFFAGWFLPIVISTLYILIKFSSLPHEIPLFYSHVWGQTQLAKTGFLYLPAGGVFLLGIFDFALAINFHSQDKIFSYLLCGTAALLGVLVLVTSFNIVNLMK